MRAESARPKAGALTRSEFAALMAPFAPFENNPTLAVAVSGGADSLALALLAHDWARERGGQAVGLTVDHGLRPESAREARRVKAWLRARDMRHHTLRWQGAKPRTGIQAAARSARYALLFDWCRRQGVLHLVLGHHADDQAETFLLRLSRGSGLDGLAAMAAVVEGPELRLLRPLLPVSKARLVVTLRARRQAWIEDPSNVDLAHARVRMRALLPRLSEEGIEPRRLGGAAALLGRSRAALEVACARLLAEAATPLPEGYVWLDPAPLARADGEIRSRALLRCLLAVSGAAYPPRLERLSRLAEELGGGLAAGRTLGGCRLAALGGRILICRELRGAAVPVPVAPGQRLAWDGRFDIRLTPKVARVRGAAGTIARLGADGWKKIVRLAPELRACGLPSLVRPTLPALWVGDQVAEVPHLGYRAESACELGIESVVWSPPHPLMGAGFSVAEMGSNII